jgi:hypothetical protein
MGGPGSGRHFQCRRTSKEELKRLDIRQMKQYCLPGAIAKGTWSWQCNGKLSGEIGVEMFEDKLVLNFAGEADDSEESCEQTIRISKTSCNFGGYRKWFHCPRCSRRIEVLYLVNRSFYCRHCHTAPYSSQQEGKLDRLCRKARKIRKRLYEKDDYKNLFSALSEPLFLKPKGLHRKTFERLKQVENQTQDEIERIMISKWGQGWY